MMVNDLLSLIARSNFALAAGVLAVLALRVPVRRLAGARIAYALWLTPPLAAAACLLPARIEVVKLPPIAPVDLGDTAAMAHAASLTLDPRALLAAWIGGVTISLIVLVLRQTRFARALGRLRRRDDLGEGVLAAESSDHGPAVLGVLRPLIITPADFDTRFSTEERRIVLEHERAHVAQGDPLINALAAALQCVSWFNPFVYIGVRALRIDQELACDAAVLATAARRTYAEAILKTQIAAGAPLGCAWPSPSLSALKERIAMLKNNLPTRAQRILGVSAVGLASFTACAVAWAAQPAHVVLVHATPAQTALPAATPPEPLASAPRAMPISHPATTVDDTTDNVDDVTDADDVNDNIDDLLAGGDMAYVDIDSIDGPQLLSAEEQAEIARSGRLTPEEQARITAAIDRAKEARAAALAHARAALAEARHRIDAAHIAVNVAASPDIQARVRLIERDAQILAHDAAMSVADREQIREEMRVNAAQIRAEAERLRTRADADARAAARDAQE